MNPEDFYRACINSNSGVIADFLRRGPREGSSYDWDGIMCYGLVYLCERPWMTFTPAPWSKSCPAPQIRTAQVMGSLELGHIKTGILNEAVRSGGHSVFQYACENKYRDMMCALVSYVDLDVISEGLVTICEARDTDTLNRLMDELDAYDTNFVSRSPARIEHVYNKALLAASYKNYLDICEILLTRRPHEKWALFGACKGGHVARVKQYLSTGMEIYVDTCVTYACEGGQLEVLKILLELKDCQFDSGLVAASKQNHVHIVQYLIESGRASNVNNAVAVAQTLRMVKYLEERGANLALAYRTDLRNYAIKSHVVNSGHYAKIIPSDIPHLVRYGVALCKLVDNKEKMWNVTQSTINAIIAQKAPWDDVARMHNIPAQVSWLVYEFLLDF